MLAIRADSELQDWRQFPARDQRRQSLVYPREARMRKPAMKKGLLALTALLLSASAHAQTPPEPPLEPHPIGTIVFLVLFVGVCVVFMWMIWRKKDDKQEKE
jgi:hypothetical protein